MADDMPPVDFMTLVLSLSASALHHLGHPMGPDEPQPEVNTVLARQNIDLLAMLEEKTKGNLSGDEERVLSQVLFDLRMQFVQASKVT